MNENLTGAIYTFCAHYHSGQWSRGYRLLCTADAAFVRKAGISSRLGYWEYLVLNKPLHPLTIIYRYLEKYYTDKM